METNKAKNIDEYIAGFPDEVQSVLEELRQTIRNAAPEAVEVISYGMPAFSQNGVLVYFAAYKNHIGFYPTSSGIATFKNEISAYKSSKGAVQFPIGSPIPFNLVSDIVKFRVMEAKEKAMAKKKNN